ncbi:hypothetical protein EYF80_033241 [Liparis tanakae]|uniref:Uncharacterized protein n=1 Tax=Liparis tanakae TaxID=230148 RepID=A0A4Z2GTQ6_9TELE|nr:hypothetical protein EYF80_033241 [Liparis tanakae]
MENPKLSGWPRRRASGVSSCWKSLCRARCSASISGCSSRPPLCRLTASCSSSSSRARSRTWFSVIWAEEKKEIKSLVGTRRRGERSQNTHLMLLQQDVGLRQVPDVLVAALQLLPQPPQPRLHVGQALVEQLRAVGVEQQPGFLLRGGLQLVPQRVEGGQALPHHGLQLGLGLHEVSLLEASSAMKAWCFSHLLWRFLASSYDVSRAVSIFSLIHTRLPPSTRRRPPRRAPSILSSLAAMVLAKSSCFFRAFSAPAKVSASSTWARVYS